MAGAARPRWATISIPSRASLRGGRYNIELWIARAEKVAQAADAFSPEECRERVVDLLLEACLPDDTVSMPAHYAQLIASAEAPVVTEAYRKDARPSMRL